MAAGVLAPPPARRSTSVTDCGPLARGSSGASRPAKVEYVHKIRWLLRPRGIDLHAKVLGNLFVGSSARAEIDPEIDRLQYGSSGLLRPRAEIDPHPGDRQFDRQAPPPPEIDPWRGDDRGARASARAEIDLHHRGIWLPIEGLLPRGTDPGLDVGCAWPMAPPPARRSTQSKEIKCAAQAPPPARDRPTRVYGPVSDGPSARAESPRSAAATSWSPPAPPRGRSPSSIIR